VREEARFGPKIELKNNKLTDFAIFTSNTSTKYILLHDRQWIHSIKTQKNPSKIKENNSLPKAT